MFFQKQESFQPLHYPFVQKNKMKVISLKENDCFARKMIENRNKI